MCFYACNTSTTDQNSSTRNDPKDSLKLEVKEELPPTQSIDSIEVAMQAAGLIDVSLLNPNIVVDLRYGTDSNFLSLNIYGGLNKAYLEENTAKKLALAQFALSAKHPELSIKVWDAARPVSCQRKMWNSVKLPAEEKGRFVSNPKNHSLHNYGCAVDVTLVMSDGTELDMGTRFDQFDSLSQPKYESMMLLSGQLTTLQVSNRQLLREIMTGVGFTTISSEWWHFNACTREFAKTHYRVID